MNFSLQLICLVATLFAGQTFGAVPLQPRANECGGGQFISRDHPDGFARLLTSR
ncbi:uncharacterized protein MYCGRDRAFT_103126 [Zymoseptoria tritici IPO323]|uniref:Uncharacterized protein n=1 Tax=Zymoseptoria tritici (strain CBS 115943 / IPO323) TaxID=336722 RepID=F9X2R8_ZYMTI|nr:uncharacterized protein MYCGRDRAFT_103126 [Zymoseptoria tritici IPO323]EGP89814.1 hypothetical protein MYCGRDRAFT_103126 [Zymoseptoria tritici IPO323]